MNQNEDKHRYDDIIDLPHHVSATRPRMSNLDRAAQFAPFAALVGYDAAVKETARLTDERTELDENSKSILNEKLQLVLEQGSAAPEIMFTYFVPDEKKAGGAYVTASGRIRKLDAYERVIVLEDGNRIPMDQILDLDSELFQSVLFE